MRTLTLIALAAALLTAPALAQNFSKAKQNIQDQLRGAQEEHNQQLQNAMGNNQPQPQQQQPPAALPGQLPIKTGWLTRKAKDSKTDVRLYFAYPRDLNKSAPAAGLVVLQEWWGINDDIKSRVDDFAKHGYYAVAPDLYHGKLTADPAEAQKLHDAMTNEAALTDMKTAADLLEEESHNGVVDPNRIGSIGWCMGGQQSLLLSLADPRIKATVIFYGPLVIDPEKLKALQGPVLGIFGNNDKAPSPSDVAHFQDALKTAGKTDVTIYPFDGVGHAFASPPAAKLGLYNEPKAKEAWQKTWTWLDQKLGKK